MRRATENQGNTRTGTECFSSKDKVKDLTNQQRSLPHFASFLQETPMKPSQVPNQLPYPAPRRMLSLESPELCHRDRPGPPWHPPHPQGPLHSSGFVSSSLSIRSSANGPHHTGKDRQCPPYHSTQPPGSPSDRMVPVSLTNSGTTANRPHHRPPSISHPPSAQFMKDLSNNSPSSHVTRDKMITLSYSGSKHLTAQRQESNKVQSSGLRTPVPTVQLHRPPMTPPLNTRVAHEVCPQAPPDHRSPGNSLQPQRGHQPPGSPHSSDRNSLPVTHSSGALFQEPHCERLPSSETLTSEVGSNCSSQKRGRESEHADSSAKKLFLAGANSGKAQMPKPAVGNSLSTLPASQPSSRHSSALEPPLKTTDSSLCTKAACSQSTWMELSSTTTQSSGTSLSSKPCTNRRPAMGAKQALINSTQSNTVELIELRTPSKVGEAILKKRREENDKTDKSSEAPLRYKAVSPHFQSGSHSSGHSQCTSASKVKTFSRNRQEESKKSESGTPKPASRPRSVSVSCRTVEQHKTARLRKSLPILDDIDQLFTPDPMTYVVSPAQKTGKPRIDEGMIKSHSSEKSSCNTVSTSSAAVTGTSFHKPQAVDTKVSTAHQPQMCVPTVILERVKLENFKPLCSKDSELKKSHNSLSDRQLQDENVKSDEKRTSPLPAGVRSCSSEADTAASEPASSSHRSQSPVLGRQASEGDPIDVELGLDLSFALDLDLTQSSHSSEGEPLLSFQEIMECVTKPPDTPEKGAFSEPSTPGHQSCPSKLQPLPPATKMGIYKNNLDQMLKEINTNKRAKEIETRLLTACKEDLLRIAEYEEAEENREEGISTEHQEFLQRYSLMSNAIREVPPGEVVFNLQKFGQIFNHNTLQLRQCIVNPHRQAQKTLLWSSPAQLRLHVNIGLFQEAYDCCSPCPTQVTRFLFKMMSVHSERMMSEKILQALCDIASTAAHQIVKNGSQQFEVWVPSLADVALVLMNMGVAFVTLFPFENLQPPFTEGDLLEDIYIKSESPSSNDGQSTFPEHNYSNILRYLSYCMGLCPRAYSDDELLLLLTVFGRVALDTQLVLQPSVELYPLQYKIINNIRDWSSMLPRICLALTDLTDDHHNMCLLVQLLPDNTRGKQLRRHLSLSMISKLLDGSCTYRPTEPEIELCKLRPYLPRMQPSTILRGMVRSSRSQKDKEEDMTTLDQQSYYLCYSLLTLANEASNFQFFPAHQKEQLLVLCSELETHVKCDIRESEKCLYRSKVKDLVARIYTKWQMLLQRTRPLHGKLYDYWQPLPVDTLSSSQEETQLDNSDDGEEAAMDEDEGEETSGTEDNEVVMITEDEDKEEGDDTVEDTNKTGDDTKSEEMDGNCTTDDTNEKEEARESVHEQVNQEMPEMEPRIQESEETAEHTEAVNHTEEPENVVDTRETSHPDQEAASDLVS